MSQSLRLRYGSRAACLAILVWGFQLGFPKADIDIPNLDPAPGESFERDLQAKTKHIEEFSNASKGVLKDVIKRRIEGADEDHRLAVNVANNTSRYQTDIARVDGDTGTSILELQPAEHNAGDNSDFDRFVGAATSAVDAWHEVNVALAKANVLEKKAGKARKKAVSAADKAEKAWKKAEEVLWTGNDEKKKQNFRVAVKRAVTASASAKGKAAHFQTTYVSDVSKELTKKAVKATKEAKNIGKKIAKNEVNKKLATDVHAPTRSYYHLPGRQILVSNLVKKEAFDVDNSKSELLSQRLRQLFELTDELANYTFDKGPLEKVLLKMMSGAPKYEKVKDFQYMPINVSGTKTWCVPLKYLKEFREVKNVEPLEEGLGDGRVIRLGEYTAPDGNVASVFQKQYATPDIAMDFLAVEHLMEKQTVALLESNIGKFFSEATEKLKQLKLHEHLVRMVKWRGGGHLIKLHITQPEVGNGAGVQPSDSFRVTGVNPVVTFETLPSKFFSGLKIMNWKRDSKDEHATQMVAPFNPHSKKNCIASGNKEYLPTINRDYNLVHLRVQGEATSLSYTEAVRVTLATKAAAVTSANVDSNAEPAMETA